MLRIAMTRPAAAIVERARRDVETPPKVKSGVFVEAVGTELKSHVLYATAPAPGHHEVAARPEAHGVHEAGARHQAHH
jgi:hypothetical protein